MNNFNEPSRIILQISARDILIAILAFVYTVVRGGDDKIVEVHPKTIALKLV